MCDPSQAQSGRSKSTKQLRFKVHPGGPFADDQA
jgi:hypothetical protein